jgi:hypothetical protein
MHIGRITMGGGDQAAIDGPLARRDPTALMHK